MARRRSAWRTRLIADCVRAPVQPRGVLAKFEDLYSANADRQAAGKGPTGATVDGIRVPRGRAGACGACGACGADAIPERRRERVSGGGGDDGPAIRIAFRRSPATGSSWLNS